MPKHVIAFPNVVEFEKATARIASLGLEHEIIDPGAAYSQVGAPAVVLASEAWHEVASDPDAFVYSGEAVCKPLSAGIPDQQPPEFDEDVFGRGAVMVFAPCTSGERSIRATAHISGDLTEALPYLNADMAKGSYTPGGPSFTYMDQYRVISVYTRRIAVAKADDIVDVWRILEAIRVRVNDVWSRRGEIEPSYETRARPPALEVYKRLPRINCRECGEASCLAFAAKVWGGELDIRQCKPVFGGDHSHLEGALLQICAGLGVA